MRTHRESAIAEFRQQLAEFMQRDADPRFLIWLMGGNLILL